jgi:hypothetical protein
MFIVISSLIISSILFIKIDGYNIIYNTVIVKYEKWGRLKNMVSTKYNSPFMINYISLKMICQSLYKSFIQYMDNSVIKVDKNKYEISYIINGKLYKMIIKPLRGPSCVLDIRDDKNNDVTEHIIPYLGPNEDWNNTQFYPLYFGYNKLIFELLDGTIKIFNNNEIIIL